MDGNTDNDASESPQPVRGGICRSLMGSLLTLHGSMSTSSDLPQLLDSRGGSHVTNVLDFNKEDFSGWKDRFLVYLDGLEPYLLEVLENGPFLPRSEFLVDLNAEFYDRALSANQKRFYKRSGRVGSAKKPMDKSNETCFACGKLDHFQKDCPSNKTSTPSYPSSNKTYNKPKFYSNLTPQNHQSVDNHQKDYKVLKAEITILTKKIDAMSKSKSEKGLVAESFDLDEESVSSEDEGVTRVKAFMANTKDEPSVGKADARSVPSNIVYALGGKGKRKETISSKEVVFTKADESPSETVRAEPIGTSVDVITLVDLTQTPTVSKEIKKDYLKISLWYLDSGCYRHITGVKQYLHKYSKESGHKVVFGDSSLGDTEGYGYVNSNGITFTRVAYVNGLKHNLISISQLCDANFKVLFTKTQGTIFNQNNEVVLIAPRRKDVCVIDMSSYNEESNAFLGEAINTACYTQNKSIIIKRHGKTNYDVFKGRSPDISYFYLFGCPEHIHNHRDHLGKVDNVFFLGYSPMAKAFRVFNIRRQEMRETYHVTFSEDYEAISKSSTEGVEINFHERRSFPDDEFLVPRSKVSQSSGKDNYFPYVPAYDPLSTNNITIPDHVTPTLLNINSPDESPEFTIADGHLVHNKPDDFESSNYFEPAKVQDSIINKPISKA
ncbi:retrovirus-related pol polyprotein from transposon TNT 1-94 [Tanacetum coccineum]